ncbi:MAG: DUF11 domain-containing protein, partial [Epsilonproteobacteria bacterium]|nr:DUF11 domain-containing protein [Campylobacterota bacterium]
MALLFIGAIQSSAYALTVGQHIENQAQVYYSVAGSDKSIETNKVETEIGTVPATLEFLAYDANHADKNVTLQSTSYYASSGLNTMSAPRLNSGEVLDTTHIIPVRDGDIYASNDLLIVRVIDIEANQLIGVIDKIEVTLINGEDRETLQLRESEINSGVFVGYIQLVNQENTQGDGELYVQPNDTISGTYQQISDSAKIAPEAKVFLSENGKVLANVEVFLLDAITGEVRYSTITDENGVYSFANVEAGNYILYSDYAVTPQVAEGASVGAAYVDSGYESFSIKVLHTESGPFLAMDIPFSRKEVSVWLEKQASKERVGLGEFIQYTIVVHNDTEQMVTHLKLEDILPRGLKYQKDSFTLDGETTTPIQSSDGQTLSVTLSHFIGKSIHTVRYVAEVTAGIKGNNIVNEAWLRGADNQIHSNIASSVVKLEKELFTDKGVIAGKIVDLNSSRAMQGVRLYLENAAYVVTDREGKYHFEEIDMGMHVLQVDKESLLDGYEVVPCENSLEKKGSNFSKFVEFKHGGLKRVDFCIENVEGIIHKNTEEKVFTQEKEKMPTYGASDIASQIKKHTILWPPKGYIPAIPSTKLAIVHPKDERAVVYLNGSRVSLFNYDTSINGKKREKVMTLYKGVDLLQGDNLFEVKFFSKQGEYTSSVKREIHISGAPMSLKYHED